MERFKAGYPSDLTEDMSPTLPKQFPKNLLPNNICEIEFLTFLNCVQVFGVQMQCQNEYKFFLECKRDRDVQLFNRIKEWETDYFSSQPDVLKKLYFQGLSTKLKRLENEIESMPSSFFYQNKKKRYEADIDQLKWRISYLKNI